MRSVEEQLKMKKLDVDNIEIPQELEDRLRSALDSVEKKPEKLYEGKTWLMRHKGIAAVLAFFVFFSIYNYDVFAYYGKKIMGYDEVSYGSLKELNELGMGQEINKSYKFKNGTEVLLDGVMMDDNKLVVMYTVKSDNEEKTRSINAWEIAGSLGRYHSRGGRGISKDNNTEVKWMMDFEAPRIFDRTLSLVLTSTAQDESKGEVAKIKFRLDRSKAIKRMVKLNLNKSIEFQGVKYNFTNISATAMSVKLEGNIQVQSEEDRKLFAPEDSGYSPFTSPRRNLRVELIETYIKDGKEVTEVIQEEGGGGGSNGNNITFRYEFSGLKSNLKKLVLRAVKTEDMRVIDASINVDSKTTKVKVVPDTEELIIEEVREENGNTVVVLYGEKDVAYGPALFVGDKQAEEISADSKIINLEGKEIMVKNYRFKGYGDDMKLMFKTISHETYINKEITLYEEN